MSFLGALILAALILLTVFTLANWAVLTATTTLSFVIFEIEGPLGVILLGAMVVLVTLFVLYAMALRTKMLMASHRHSQELQAQRKLAEAAEASRLSGLQAQMVDEFAQLRDVIKALDDQMAEREKSINQSFDEATNSLSAMVGELDDKVDRVLPQLSRS